MENLRELQAQAQQLERAGQLAPALELYRRVTGAASGRAAGAAWSRLGRVQLALGKDAEAADSFASAAEHYDGEGLNNLALAFAQRAVRADGSRPALLLSFGRLSAAQGYARDARHGYVEYADRAVAEGDAAAAVAALREYLQAFSGDAAVRRRLAELTGEPELEPAPAQEPTAAPAPSAPAAVERDAGVAAESLPGLVPTAHDAGDDSTDAAGRIDDTLKEPGPDAAQIAPLEGLEPTHAGDDYHQAPAGAGQGTAEAAPDDAGVAPYAAELPGLEEDGAEGDVEAEPLPLLGSFAGEDFGADDPGAATTTGADALPLIGVAEEPLRPADAVEAARARVSAAPDDPALRRDLVALLRERGDPSLEAVLEGAEQHFAAQGRFSEALEFVEQLAAIRTQDTAVQQRRVERALRAGNRASLVEGYLTLAARFEAELDTARAQDALRRVLELDPANEEARAALASVSASAAPPQDYVDLGDLILADAPEEVTRFQVAIGEPTGNEESDFAEILDLFRRKVSESLDPKDAASHYDLGLAFKEMGLLDDAIIHLQSGLRGGANPLATLEELGECFVLKGQVSLAARVFERATRLEGVSDSDLVGVLYGLARCQEQLGQLEEAKATLERVVAVDLAFRDAAGRLQLLQSR